MKSRVIIKHRKYVPQVKVHWWNAWSGLCRGYAHSFFGFYAEFNTLEEAIAEIKTYKEQKIDEGKVVWSSET